MSNQKFQHRERLLVVVYLHFMKSNKEILDIILDIERSVPVDEIEYKAMKIWPIIRVGIWKQLTSLENKSETRDGARSSKKYAIKYFFSKMGVVLSYIKYILYKKEYGKKDVVFLSSPNNRWEKVDGKYFRPFSNSLQDISKEAKVESIILDIAPKKQNPVYGETHFILEEIENICSMYRIIDFLKTSLHLEKTEQIYSLDKLIKFAKSKYPELVFGRQFITERADKILFCERMFKKILNKC